MAEETLLTAARRVVRFILVNDAHDGGLLTRETLQAIGTLDTQVRREEERQKRARLATVPAPGVAP